MDVTRTEEEQLEALRKWWTENGLSVAGGVVIGLGAIFGWRGWQAYQLEQATAASDIYSAMIVEIRQEKNDKARESANKLLDEYSSTSYAVFASLLLAKLDVEVAGFAAAAKHLQWVLDNADQNEIKLLARLRLGRVLLDDNKPEQALAIVSNIDAGEFAPGYEELKGDIYMRIGQQDKAKTAYQLSLAGMDESMKDNSFLQMKIDDIGHQNKE